MTDKPKKGHGKDPNKWELVARATTLKDLVAQLPKGHDLTFSKAWAHGIEKDHPLTPLSQ